MELPELGQDEVLDVQLILESYNLIVLGCPGLVSSFHFQPGFFIDFADCAGKLAVPNTYPSLAFRPRGYDNTNHELLVPEHMAVTNTSKGRAYPWTPTELVIL